jgi:hypothetical protein
VGAILDVPAPEMLIEDLLPRRTVTGLTAYPGIGKTWFALELARAVVTAGKVCGRHQAKPGSVVYVGQDASVQDYAQQLRKLIRDEYDLMQHEVNNRVRETNPFEDRMHFIVQPGILLEEKKKVIQLASTVMSIKHSEQREMIEFDGELQHTVTVAEGVDLIILDTLSSMTRTNQNDNTAMETVFGNLKWLREVTRAGIILVHHNSKPTEFNSGEDWRGATSQIAALDNWLHLMHVPHTPPDRRLLKIKKFRGLRPPDFHFDLVIDEQRARLVAQDPAASPPSEGLITFDVKEEVIAVLARKREFMTAREIQDAQMTIAAEMAGVNDLYKKICIVLKDPANESLIEKGPRKMYRLRETPLEKGGSEEIAS